MLSRNLLYNERKRLNRYIKNDGDNHPGHLQIKKTKRKRFAFSCSVIIILMELIPRMIINTIVIIATVPNNDNVRVVSLEWR